MLSCTMLVTAGACGRLPDPSTPSETARAVVKVQGSWLGVRLSRPSGAQGDRPLVLFITGDGGWRGKDLDAFSHLMAWGYPVVGVSAPEYLDLLPAARIPAQELADDLAAVIDTGRRALDLPSSTPVLLFGVSRGADLAVVAAARRSLRATVRGVVAVGLTEEEEFVHRSPRRTHRAVAASRHQDDDAATAYARPYVALRSVTAPVSVIQSTHDEYVSAADARQLFGPDSASRRFHAIESRNHSFSDARDVLYATMEASLHWADTQGARQGTP